MKEISLSQGKVTLVDDDMYEELNQYKWFATKSYNTYYAERMSPYVNGKRTKIKMHHEIIGKPPEDLVTDHRNGDGLFNLRSNLYHVTNRQNCQNMKNVKKTSKFPGVHWNAPRKKWRTKIQINGKEKHLGRFTSELEAFAVYKAAVESIGEEVIDR